MHRSVIKVALFFITIIFGFHLINVLYYENIEFNKIERTRKYTNLRDILNCETLKIDQNRNIFFIDTTTVLKTNKTKNIATLTNRQACSVESAATLNPNSFVFVIFLSKSVLKTSPAIRKLRNFENVIFLKMDFLEFVKNSPTEKWVRGGAIYDSKYLVFNISDLLRVMLQWR